MRSGRIWQTSLREELGVDVFKSLFIHHTTGTLLWKLKTHRSGKRHPGFLMNINHLQIPIVQTLHSTLCINWEFRGIFDWRFWTPGRGPAALSCWSWSAQRDGRAPPVCNMLSSVRHHQMNFLHEGMERQKCPSYSLRHPHGAHEMPGPEKQENVVKTKKRGSDKPRGWCL